MPVDIFPDDVWHEVLIGPANTDKVTGPSVSDPLKLVGDNLLWLKNRIISFGHEKKLVSAIFTEDVGAHDFTSMIDGQRITLEKPSLVLAVMHLPMVTIDRADTELSLAAYDNADTFEALGYTRIYGTVATYENTSLMGYFSLDVGDYGFGIRVNQGGAGTFQIEAGNFSVMALALGQVAT
jgi:hypothetical protein